MKKKASRQVPPKKQVQERSQPDGRRTWAERWPDLLLGAVVALLVARTLVPEDAGSQEGYGAPFVMLWLLVVAAWLLGQLRRGTLVVRWGWPDVAVLALFGWHTASALLAVATGAPRPALNMLWDWVAMGLAYFLVRQLVRSTHAIRAVVAAMIGLACGLSLLAVHQAWVTIPAAHATYEAIKDSTEALYLQTGQWMPPGSSVRQQFESRLASSLPTATFALSNSLAGFLVPWLVVLGGVLIGSMGGWGRAAGEPPAFRARVKVALGLLVMVVFALCIVLAGSRSAGVAAIAGLLLASIPFVRTTVWPRWWLRFGAMAVAAAGVVGSATFAFTSPGQAALVAAWRSVTFRLEYWQATVAMMADSPWFGCGPGQFQDTYTAYKLPGAAEEIQDPHNWILEVWATAGTPAALALVVLLGLVLWQALRLAGSTSFNGKGDARVGDNSTPLPVTNVVALVGGLVGVVLGSAISLWSGFPLMKVQMALLAAGMVGVWWLLRNWIREGPLPPRLPMVAAVALLVNLLAAGGMGFPSVADSLWLLVAVQLSLSESGVRQDQPESVGGRRPVPSPRTRMLGWVSCVSLAAAVAAALGTEYLPVLGCRLQLNMADAARSAGRADFVRTALEAAVAADPWSAAAAERLAEQRFADYESLSTATQLRSFSEAQRRALLLAPRRSGAWAQAAERLEAIHQRSNNVEDFQAAERHWRQAIALYPTHAELHGRLAKLLARNDRLDEARAAAAEALRLDDLMRSRGHRDRLLDPSQRSELEQLVKHAG